jgi:hypothetical protein
MEQLAASNEPNNLEPLEFSKDNRISFIEPPKRNKMSDSEDGSVSVDGDRKRRRSQVILTEEKKPNDR